MRSFVVLSIILIGVFSTVSSQDSEAPYIYYHSAAINAIVIERADGSDSRAIARGLMPADHNFVSNIQWSPSGEWVAWTSGIQGGYSARLESVWIMRANGSEQLMLLDDIAHNILHVSWSPTGDYLLIIEQFRNGSTLVTLVDVANGEIIASFDDTLAETSFIRWDTRFWSADGNSVQIYVGAGYEGLRIIYVDGTVVENVPYDDLPPLEPTIERPDYTPPILSPDGNFEVEVEFEWIMNRIRNLQTNELITLRPYSGGFSGICGVDWHHQFNWLLMTFSRSLAGSMCNATGTSVIYPDSSVQRELGPCHMYVGCAGWLPERVLERLADGQQTSIVPEPLLTIENDGWVIGVAWQSDGIHLVTYSERRIDRSLPTEYMLKIWDTGANPPEVIQSYPVEQCDVVVHDICTMIWNTDETQIGLTSGRGSQVIDLKTGEIVETSENYLLAFDDDDVPIYVDNAIVVDLNADRQLIAQYNCQDEFVEVSSFEIGEISYLSDFSGQCNVNSIAFVPDTNYVVFYRGGEIYLWHLDTNTFDELPNFSSIKKLSVFDSQTIIGFGRLSLLHFWDVETRSLVARLNRYVRAVDVNDDLTRMVTGAGYMIEIWDYQTIMEQSQGN